MRKAAPSWGKAIGIIMICLGSLGVFYQIYKIMVPRMLRLMSGFGDIPRYNGSMDRGEEMAFDQLTNMIRISESEATIITVLGYIGILLLVLYVVAGVKLLTAEPANYNLAKYALGVFIAYNAIGLLLFLTSVSNYVLGMVLTYSIVGLVIDIALIIVLLSSNKGAYGIGVDTSMTAYTLDPEDEEII